MVKKTRQLNEDWVPPKKSYRWKGRGLTIKGKWFPLESLSTKDLINYLEILRKKTKLTPVDRRKQKYIGWIVKWRNRRPEYLPKHLRYQQQKWCLEEVTEYNHPTNIHELSVLYRLALLRDDLPKITLLRDLLLCMGYVYKPPRYDAETQEWLEDTVTTLGEWLDDEDKLILMNRKLDFKLI